METGSVTVDAGDFKQLLCDVALIKQRLDDVASLKEILIANRADSEGKVSDWAKNELTEARKIPDSENISLEELERQIASK